MKLNLTPKAISYHRDLSSAGKPLVVHSVFRNSLHVELPGGSIATLTTAGRDGPLTVRLHTSPWDDSWLGQTISLDHRGTLSHAYATKALHAPIARVVDMSGATPWHPDRTRVDWRLEDLQRRSSKLHRLSGRSAIIADNPCRSALSDKRAELLRTLRLRDTEGVSAAATGLIGLGPGLTPSGMTGSLA